MRELFRTALQEDLQKRGDITSLGTIAVNAVCSGQIVAKQAGVLCGVEIAQAVFLSVDPKLTVEPIHNDGSELSTGESAVKFEGATRSILAAERTALNFIQRLSGVATLTRKYVEQTRGFRAKILDTRKTTPGFRSLEKYAVRVGGGYNHRFGLYDMMLLKENHIVAAGGITPAVNAVVSYRNTLDPDIRIEVEVTNMKEVREVLELPVDRIMLDNMSLANVAEAVRLVAGRVETEVSGGIGLADVKVLAETGVDFISVGALTHSAPAMDYSLLLDKTG